MTESNVHLSAHVASTVKLGAGVTVGAFAVIEDDVTIGDQCVIGTHAIIRSCVTIGAKNEVFPNAVIGEMPQDLNFDKKFKTYVSIGDNNVFREGVTVNRASQENSSTRIGSRCFFMNNSHIGHDCIVGDDNVFATGVALGGHVRVDDKVFLGGGVMVHQFCRIGSLVMVRGVTGVSMDVLPYTLVGGLPARHYRLNTVGLRRAGIKGERYSVLSQAFRKLRRREGIKDLQKTPEICHLQDWLNTKSIRGIHGFAVSAKPD